VRWIGIIAIFAVLVAVSADAMDVNRPCSGLLEEEKGWADDSSASGEQPLLMDNQCEALKSRELRLRLLEIPQEEEDPIALSLGVKNGGVVLRFKIPFSF
jgi:hypothetical protein